MKSFSKILLILMFVLISCGGQPTDRNVVQDSSGELTRYYDPEWGVMCYSIDSRTLDCVKVAGNP